MNDSESYNANDDNYQELVAYLDGELDTESSERVERRLAEDADYRRELRQLQLTWDMLDELPKAEVDERFTQTTVEMVVLSAQQDLDELKDQTQRKNRTLWAWVGGGVLAVAVASYLIFATVIFRPNQRLLEDLPVIEDVDLYRVADSVEFLQELDERELFDVEVDDAL